MGREEESEGEISGDRQKREVTMGPITTTTMNNNGLRFLFRLTGRQEDYGKYLLYIYKIQQPHAVPSEVSPRRRFSVPARPTLHSATGKIDHRCLGRSGVRATARAASQGRIAALCCLLLHSRWPKEEDLGAASARGFRWLWPVAGGCGWCPTLSRIAALPNYSRITVLLLLCSITTVLHDGASPLYTTAPQQAPSHVVILLLGPREPKNETPETWRGECGQARPIRVCTVIVTLDMSPAAILPNTRCIGIRSPLMSRGRSDVLCIV